jgi:hypothetical protein
MHPLWRRRIAVGAVGATALAVSLTLAVPGIAATTRAVSVNSMSTLQKALDAAQPGDRIELADGSYSAGNPIRITRSGTATAPVTVAAAHVGKAEIKGSSGFEFDASFVVVEGFKLTHGDGLVIPTTVHNVRLTRNLVQISRGSTVNWLDTAADNVEIDHNTFQHKSTLGNFIEVTGPGDHDMAKNTWIHHNYFLDHSFRGSNGGESIRVGVSQRQHGSARALVEWNLFEKCNGDAETISVKSSDDIVRDNTLLNSKGSIVLRHGNRNLVDGNLMLGGSSGIRFYGNDHTIVNNVVQNTTGQAIEVGGGEIRDDTKSTTAHEAADRVLVAFNTLVNDRSPAVLVGSSKKFAPSEITFADDLVVGRSGNAVNVRQGSGLHWLGNIVWGVKVGNAPAAGFKTVNPNVVQDAGGLWRLRAGSPAIDAAQGSYPQVTTDFDAQARTGAKDVGADEFAAGGPVRAPLTPANVGPNAP